MMSENVKALASYRLEQAEESLVASKVLLDQDLIRLSVNRSYYAMFYAVLALLAARGEETSKHSGAIALFDRAFVKSGIFPKEFSRWLHDAFDLRQQSDYSPQAAIGKDEAVEIKTQAETFVSRVRAELGRMFGTPEAK